MPPQRAFRFGVFTSGAVSYQDWQRTARKAEELGYAILLVPDHFRNLLAPRLALLAAAEATHTLRSLSVTGPQCVRVAGVPSLTSRPSRVTYAVLSLLVAACETRVVSCARGSTPATHHQNQSIAHQ